MKVIGTGHMHVISRPQTDIVIQCRFSDGKSLEQLVNELVDDIKHLPTRLIQVSINMEGFVKELHTFDGNTAIEEIKTIVKEMHDLIFSVQSDLLKFYNVSTSSK